MPPRAAPPPDPRLLQQRLAAVRRRLRLVSLVRGGSGLLAVLLLAAVAGGLLDWRLHLPGLARAALLVSSLAAAGYVAYRYLFLPLAARADDLTLALRLEEHYPGLNDSLASAVEFVREGERLDPFASPSLRQVAVARTLHVVERCDFGRVVNTRGLRRAGLSALLGAGLAAAALLLYPTLAWTALQRLAHPFGAAEWPRDTRLDVQPFRDRLGRNELFEVRAVVRGVVPEKATAVFRLDRFAQSEHAIDVQPGPEPGTGLLVARLEPGRVQRDFRFQLRAHDAATPWYDVAVLPPPLLVPIDGRASPQVTLHYPGYTDLPPLELPDGIGNVDAVAGTVVSLRAAADRPLARAWVEFYPEAKHTGLAACLAPLGAAWPPGGLALHAAGAAVWDRQAASLDAGRQVLAVRFRPFVSGLYALHFEDDTGLRNSRLFELRTWPDPQPTVTLERPSPKHDLLEVLPDAELPVKVEAEDTQYAVRSLYLEYRLRTAGGKEPAVTAPRRVPLYDHADAVAALRPFAAFLPPSALAPSRFKRQQAEDEGRLELRQLRHPDRPTPGLREGDVVVLQACADDFDDVTPDKGPGRSHEVEIRVVSRNALEVALNREQGNIQQELVRLREQQREALKKVTAAEKTLQRTGRLSPDDLAQLLQAEHLQAQIRERVGNRGEGLRSEVKRVLDSLENNRLPRSAAHERMELVDSELGRLAREELEQIEPQLTRARKQFEADPRTSPKKDARPLTEARQRQEEVEKTLNDLLTRLEPWSSTREIKGEAKSLLQEQQRLNQDVEGLQKNLGRNRDDLTPAQQAELDRAAAAQQKLQERTGQLLDKMDRVAAERQDKDPATAGDLKKAAELGRRSNVTGLMQQAQEQIAQNNTAEAARTQKEAADRLEKLVKELEDRREDELDRLVKKLRDAERQLDELSRRQERLQKDLKAAAQITDPQKRAEEVKRLTREQEQLRQEAQDLLRRLSRLRAERAAQALGKAAGQMEQAGRQADDPRAAQEAQDEALDRLDEAREELQREREAAEEELAREQLARVADAIRRLKDRQDALAAELARLNREALQRQRWERGPLISLGDLARNQLGLAEESRRLAEDKLTAAPVFARVLQKAAAAMEQAAARMLEHRQQAGRDPRETGADEHSVRLQQEAARRLTQLLEALKEGEGGAAGAARPPGGGGGGDGGGGGGGDGIPPLAQLKLLRDLQAEVNRRTEEFNRKHPDLKKLDEAAKAELHDLRREQQEVADLLERVTQPVVGEGDKP